MQKLNKLFHMLISTRPSNEDKVITFLSSNSEQTALQIYKAVADNHTYNTSPITLQGIYRILRKLEQENVIWKIKKQYSLRIPWLLDLSSLVHDMEKTYLKEEFVRSFIPKEDKQKVIWSFNNLNSMNDFWIQMLLSLAHLSETGYSLSTCPHIWMERIHDYQQEDQFRKNYLQKITEYCVVENKSFLDKYIRDKQDGGNSKDLFYLAQEDEYITKKRNVFVDIIDDYILKMQFDCATAAYLDKTYKKMQSLVDVLSFDIRAIFSRSIKCKIIIKKDTEAVEKYRRKFKRIFGPLENKK